MNKKNTGVKKVKPKLEDYVFQKVTGIVQEVRFPDGDCTKYITKKERQFNDFMDTMACTSFSRCHLIEIHLNWMLENKKFSDTQLTWLNDNKYIVDGKFDLSERFLASASGTTKNGNDIITVADTARNIGMVPHYHYPFVSGMSWDEFYKPIPQYLIEMAGKFKDMVDMQYEWVGFWTKSPVDKSVLKEAIKYSPLQITIPFAQHHATVIAKVDDLVPFTVYDTYDPFIFLFNSDSEIAVASKAMVTIKTAPVRQLRYGMIGTDVFTLQSNLRTLGYFTYPINTLYFGNVTRLAVIAFQKANGIDPIGEVGPITRTAIANAMTKKKA